jgi:hypothetical protein
VTPHRRMPAEQARPGPREPTVVLGCCNALAQWCKRRIGARPSDFGVSVCECRRPAIPRTDFMVCLDCR